MNAVFVCHVHWFRFSHVRRLSAKRYCHTLHASLENTKPEEQKKAPFGIHAFYCEGMRAGRIPCTFKYTRYVCVCAFVCRLEMEILMTTKTMNLPFLFRDIGFIFTFVFIDFIET